MNDESYGLRFDIYERVHLSDEVVGIDQLEEVELTPHIQVIPAGDQVTVRGSLLLAGAYVGADEMRSSHSLEHWIPVEITLPLNRVRSLDDISVDIEHFDVDLLSTRTLNITGILSLRGISMESIEPAAWEPEQFTVVHQTDLEQDEEEPSWLRDYGTYTPAFTSNHEESLSENSEDSNDESDAEPEAEYREYHSAQNPEEQEQQQEQEEALAQDEEEEESCTRAVEEVRALENEDGQLSAQANYEASDITSSHSERVPLTWSGTQWNKEALGAEEHVEIQSVEASKDERQASSETCTDSYEGERLREAKETPSDSVAFSDEAPTREPAASYDKRERKERVSSAEADDTAAAQSSEENSTRDEEREGVEDTAAIAFNEQEDAVPAAAVKQEMKVAIGKGKNNEPEADEPLGFSSLLQKKREPQEAERDHQEEETAQQSASNAEAAGEEVKWQSLFLQRLEDERAFKKVRMCIVQRSETLDTIADRYSMNSREIALYNRLGESDVSEGQVLYIPTT